MSKYKIIKDAYERFGYEFFTKPYSINIGGIRLNETKPNSFDDVIFVAYIDDNGKEICELFEATTDPGVTVLGKKFGGTKGTLIMIAGQYYKMFKKGYHKGKYPALQQNIKVEVLRDTDKDELLSFNDAEREYGFFGINLHRSNKYSTPDFVNNHSFGCQVIKKYSDWLSFWDIIEKSSDIFGDEFSYTLFSDYDFDNQLIKKLQ